MSQSIPPPGNPFAGGAVPFAPTPPRVRRANVAGGVVAALIAALVAAGVYGGIIGASHREVSWAAIGVGFLVGFAAGKIGGSHSALPAVSAALSLGAVYLGQLVGLSILIGKDLKMSATDVFVNHFSALTSEWSKEMDAMSYLFLAIAAFAAFSAAKRTAA